MKNAKLVLWIMRVSLFALLAGILGFYFGYSKENDPVLIVSLVIAGIAALGLIVSIVLSLLPDKEIKETWQGYLWLLADENNGENALQGFDYAEAIARIRENFASDNDKYKNRFQTTLTGIAKSFSVLGSGKICYGCLVEANDRLFRPARNAREVLPAVFVYSTDSYFDNRPEDLRDIAQKVSEDKEHNFLKNERNYFSNVCIPEEICDGKTVYATVIAVYRRHIPLGTFSGGEIVPIIADPAHCDDAYIIDSKYWTEDFIIKFLKYSNI